MSQSIFTPLVLRDLRLAWRRPVNAWLPIAFFAVAASLFPLGVGPEPQVLGQIAGGVVWVCALLSALMGLGLLFETDLHDGSLEQMMLAGQSSVSIAIAKALTHWLLTGLPLIVVGPILGSLFGMSFTALVTLFVGLLLGTPVLSLLGSFGAALTVGLNGGGALLMLLILPLCIPVLIFGAGAVTATESGVSASGHLSLLGAILILAFLALPPATGAALRVSTS